MWLSLLLGGLLILLFLIYKFWTSQYNYWESRGIRSLGATFPFGTSKELALLKEFQGTILQKMYTRGAPDPMFGIYILRNPILVVRDPQLIQTILVKEFSHFRDRVHVKVADDDHLFNHMVHLNGDNKWKILRIKLSPTFTTGRMKGMFPLFVTCAEALDKVLLEHMGSTYDVKDVHSRFSTDLICSCAFGLDTQGKVDNELIKMLSTELTFSFHKTILFICMFAFPKMFDYFQFRFTPKKTEDYILNLIKTTVKYREDNSIKRNDFLDLLIQLKNKEFIGEETTNEEDYSPEPIEMTTELMAAQCFVFFIAGYETSSSVQTFCLYEMALNPQLQDRLQEEIDTVVDRHGGVTYQAVQEMPYLDMVISETLRKYPSLPTMQRMCTKDYELPTGQTIESGTTVQIPIWGLHYDEQFFPNPEKFDPERFSPENRDSIVPFSYLPFGEGPRMCIGMRFGQLQTKIGIITALRKYRVEPAPNTPIPIKYKSSSIITCSNENIVLKLNSRKSSQKSD